MHALRCGLLVSAIDPPPQKAGERGGGKKTLQLFIIHPHHNPKPNTQQNPTNDVFEKRVAALEGGVGAVGTPYKLTHSKKGAWFTNPRAHKVKS